MLHLGRLSAAALVLALGACADEVGLPLAPMASAANDLASDGAYRMTDLGTIAGTNGMEVLAINASGNVLVRAYTYDMDLNVTYSAYVWRNGAMTNLGTLGGPSTYPMALNDRGQVVGFSQRSSGGSVAFLWENGSMSALNVSAGSSFANDVNEAGQVVGQYQAGGRPRAFLWDAGTVTDLGSLGGNGSVASSINESGQVAGTDFATVSEQAFFWSNGVMTDLGMLTGQRSNAIKVNDAGDVIGTWQLNFAERGFFWRGGVMTDLGTLGSRRAIPKALNARGQVAGWSYNSQEDPHAFLWENGVMTDLGTLGGEFSIANAMNDQTQVVGNAQNGDGRGRAFLWQEGVMSDLGALAGAIGSAASAINENGVIVGISVMSTGATHVTLWEPVVGCSVAPSEIWPADNKMTPVRVSMGADIASFTLRSVTNDESGASDADGFAVGTADIEGNVRASRDGNGDGRVYTLVYDVVRSRGGAAVCAVTVTVPHDQSKK